MVIAILVFLLFVIDLIFGCIMTQPTLAPFKGANWVIDVVFSICAAILFVMSWFTFKEQK